MDRSRNRLHRQGECSESTLCADKRRGVVRRLIAKLRWRRGARVEWRGPEFGGGDPAGVREPRRPKPSAGSEAMALEVPRAS
jgi:hypothetical protein